MKCVHATLVCCCTSIVFDIWLFCMSVIYFVPFLYWYKKVKSPCNFLHLNTRSNLILIKYHLCEAEGNRIHTHKLLDIAMSKICLASNSLNESISYSNYLNCDFLELQKQLWDNCKSYHICKNYLHGRIMANLSSGQRY